MARAASVVPASSAGSGLPRVFLLARSGEGGRDIPLWVCWCVWAESGKRALLLLPSEPPEDASQSSWRYRYVWKQKTKSDPLLVQFLQRCQARMHSFGDFSVCYFSQPCNNRSWFLASELLLSTSFCKRVITVILVNSALCDLFHHTQY